MIERSNGSDGERNAWSFFRPTNSNHKFHPKRPTGAAGRAGLGRLLVVVVAAALV